MSKCCDWHTQIICQFTYLHIFFIFRVWYLTHQKFSFKISLSKLLFITELRQRMEFQKETAIVVVSIGWIQRRNEQRRSNNEATKASTHVCNLVLQHTVFDMVLYKRHRRPIDFIASPVSKNRIRPMNVWCNQIKFGSINNNNDCCRLRHSWRRKTPIHIQWMRLPYDQKKHQIVSRPSMVWYKTIRIGTALRDSYRLVVTRAFPLTAVYSMQTPKTLESDTEQRIPCTYTLPYIHTYITSHQIA